jgi:hypothetical protein
MKAMFRATAVSAVSIAGASMLLIAAQSTMAVTPSDNPKVVQKAKQPQGKATKTSSFAPHPTTRRVFGDPIQPAIVGHVQPKKPPNE